MSGHPSWFELETLHVGDAPRPRAEELRRHVEVCASCRAYLDELEGARRAFRRRQDPEQFAARVRRAAEEPPRPSWWTRWRFVWVPATAALLAVAGIGLWPTTPPGRVRTRGTLQATVLLERGGVVSRVEGGALVSPGDTVRFKLDTTQGCHLTVVFLDEHGSVDWLVPATPDLPPRRIGAGENLVPVGATFDDSGLSERAVLLCAPRAYRPADLAARLQRAWRAASPASFSSGDWLPREEGLRSFVFDKQRP